MAIGPHGLVSGNEPVIAHQKVQSTGFSARNWSPGEGGVIESGYGSQTIFQIEYSFVLVTKYRYKVLQDDVAERVRELGRQTCEAFEIRIVWGVVSKDHGHILVSAPPTLAPSEIMRRIPESQFKLARKAAIRINLQDGTKTAEAENCSRTRSLEGQSCKAFLPFDAGMAEQGYFAAAPDYRSVAKISDFLGHPTFPIQVIPEGQHFYLRDDCYVPKAARFRIGAMPSWSSKSIAKIP